MKTEYTKVNSVNVSIGESEIGGIYLRTSIFSDKYGFLILGDVSLIFNSKESICALQNALTNLKEKWLVEEQEEVTESA